MLIAVIAIVSVVSAVAQTPSLAAEKTPQGVVALAYYKAANLGDVAGLKKVLTEASAKVLDGPNGKQLIEALKGQTLPGAVVTNVTTEGAVSRVDVEFKRGTRTLPDRLKLVLVGTEWRVDMLSK